MHPSFSDLPLRTQKRARTRAALVQALTTRLAERQLEDIAVSELCDEAGISQATFFNYFPSKTDLLTHFIRLWSLQMAAEAARVEAEHDSPLRAIEALVERTFEQAARAPQLMLETIAHQARMPADLRLEPVELAERLLVLPQVDDPMALPDTGLGGLLPPLIVSAVQRGELPAETDVQALTLAVACVFFGVPLVMGRHSPQLMAQVGRRQLHLLWAGARGA